MIVNGPVANDRHQLRDGRARPGWRANLTIGRALRLLVTLTGGGEPGRPRPLDAGHPGKLGFCIAEDEAAQPVGAAARRARLRARRLGRDARRLRRAAVDLRPPPHDAGGARGVPGLGRRRDVEPELVAARRDVASTSSVPSTQAMFAAAGWSKQRVREAIVRRRPQAGARAARAARRRHRSTRPTPDALVTKWDEPGRHRADRRRRRGRAILRRARPVSGHGRRRWSPGRSAWST